MEKDIQNINKMSMKEVWKFYNRNFKKADLKLKSKQKMNWHTKTSCNSDKTYIKMNKKITI